MRGSNQWGIHGWDGGTFHFPLFLSWVALLKFLQSKVGVLILFVPQQAFAYFFLLVGIMN